MAGHDFTIRCSSRRARAGHRPGRIGRTINVGSRVRAALRCGLAGAKEPDYGRRAARRGPDVGPPLVTPPGPRCLRPGARHDGGPHHGSHDAHETLVRREEDALRTPFFRGVTAGAGRCKEDGALLKGGAPSRGNRVIPPAPITQERPSGCLPFTTHRESCGADGCGPSGPLSRGWTVMRNSMHRPDGISSGRGLGPVHVDRAQRRPYRDLPDSR